MSHRPHSNRTNHKAFLAVALVAIAVARSAPAATPADIQAAVDKAKAFIYSQQKPGGHWEINAARVGVRHDDPGMQGDTFGGYTALSLYALLAAGESPNDPRLAASIKFLEDADVIGIYALGVRANVWPYIPASDKRARALAAHDAKLLIDGMQTGKENPATKGFWEYGNGRGFGLNGSPRFDHSVSQYGVLGLWACAQNDVPIPHDVWDRIDAGWKSHQYPDGGWAYDTAPPDQHFSTAPMTAAGVATLFITDDMISSGRGIDCAGNISNDNIERGLEWIAAHFKEINSTYAFYAVERIGMASGRKYFGDIDWYGAGADWLLKFQAANGSWSGGFPGGDNPVSATSFALLFLARGRQPAMISKLEYELVSRADPTKAVQANWNQRPRDIANFARWAGHQMERELSWQVVNLRAPLRDIQDAPMLYLSGDQDLSFRPQDEDKLRQFLEGGGMVVANADCPTSRKAFSTSFEKLGHRLFPKYEFRDLPDTHPIFTNQPYHANKWKTPQRLRGLSNGVREMIVLIPDADLSRTWQSHLNYKQDPAFQLGADIYLYAIDRQDIGVKGDTYLIRPDEDTIADRTTRVARLMVGDNPDPEPGGWRRMAALFHNRYRLDVDVLPMKLEDKRLDRCKVAALTGTGKFTLTAAQHGLLLEYVKRGGTLIVDAAGGNADFADSAARELKTIFGVDAEAGLAQPLDPSNTVFHLPGAQITEFTYRDMYRRQVVGNNKAPRLNAIAVNGRKAVFYSREDLSAGLVGMQVDGIAGYSPQTATEIVRNIVLSAGFGARPAVAAAAAAGAK